MAPDGSQTKTIARSAGTVGIAVFASRILGLVREQVFAYFFGAGFAYDAFVVAYRIPNLLRDLFAEGALSAAFVAVFTDYRTKKGPQATWKLANNTITAVIIIVGAVSLLGAFFSQDIVLLFTKKEFAAVAGKVDLTSRMTVIMFPFLLLVSLSAVAMGILNTLGKFFIPALASSFFNLGSIVSGVGLALLCPKFGLHPIMGMAIGVIIGGLLQVGVQLPLLFKQGLRFRPFINFTDPGLQRIMMLMTPAVIGLAAPQINLLVNTFFTSGCPEGSLSWLQYAFRLLMFPIGIVGVSLSVATMPVVSKHASTGDTPALREAYVSSTVLSLVLSVPATFGLIFLAEPIIEVIFEHGSFTHTDTVNTARALVLYATGLFAYAALKIIVPVFYALDKPKYPVIGSLLTIALNVSVIIAAVDTYHHLAIALATSLSVAANYLFLCFILYRKIGGYQLRRLMGCIGRIVPPALIMGVCADRINTLCRELLGDIPFGNLVSLLAAILLGIVMYGTAVGMMNIREVSQIRTKVLSMIAGRRA